MDGPSSTGVGGTDPTIFRYQGGSPLRRTVTFVPSHDLTPTTLGRFPPKSGSCVGLLSLYYFTYYRTSSGFSVATLEGVSGEYSSKYRNSNSTRNTLRSSRPKV